MLGRMGRPGLLGTMARTAVVAGTANTVVGGMNRRRANKEQATAEQYAAEQAAYESQTQLADLQRQVDAMKGQPPPPPPPAAAGGDDLMAALQRLADMRTSGLLDDDEFAAAKAKLLGS